MVRLRLRPPQPQRLPAPWTCERARPNVGRVTRTSLPCRIVLATKNRGKLRELGALLDEPRIELVSLADVAPPDFDVEETGTTFEENARLKAEAVARLTGLPALADDSGLEVDALGGRPGVYSKRYAGENVTDAENNARLLEELDGVAEPQRTARFVCVLALAEPSAKGHDEPAPSAVETRLLVRGTCEGHIAAAARGAAGFGYDPLFVPEGLSGRTLGEATAAEKNGLSHRGEAIRALAPALSRWLEARMLLRP
jgi:non-canonical purine NTP pyrophosphatase (RdgB/HAM1 family)